MFISYEAEACSLCSLPFSMLQRIHKCKRCLKFICQNCGKDKEKIIDQSGKRTEQKHRICDKCKEDFKKIVETIKHFQMEWGKDSTLAQEWISTIKRKDYEYDHFLKLFHRSSQNFQEQLQIIEKDVINGRTDFSVFNYSMREFFYTVQQKVEVHHETRKSIAQVLYAIAARFDRIGYCQGMSGVAAFLLCWGKEETAYIMFCDLLENVYPENFFVRSTFGVSLIGLLAEIHFLKEYYYHIITKQKNQLLLHERDPYTQEEIQHLKVVIQLVGTKALLSIFIGVLNFSNLIFVWTEIKKNRSFEVVERAFLAIIFLNRECILEHRSYKKLQEYFQKLDHHQFKQAYNDIQIDPKLRKTYIEQYYITTSKKWSQKSSSTRFSLSKVTSFNQDQIKLLQQQFVGDGLESNNTIGDMVVIDVQQFMKLIECYYEVLKSKNEEEEPILEINSYFVKKIFESYNANRKKGLDFRQLVCCFSVCTKSQLKQRMCAVLNTFQDKNHTITYDTFNKLLQNLCTTSPLNLAQKKELFLERMHRYFQNQDRISMNQLHILLNDEFINELTLYIKSECEGIVKITLELYKDKIIGS